MEESMPRPGQLSHVMLEVADLARAEAFFQKDLGLEPVGRDLWNEGRPNSAFRTSAGQYFVLVEVPEVKPDGPGVHTDFLLSIEDYHRVVDRLREAGCLKGDFRGDLGQRSVGEISQYFVDPDGHQLQVTAYSPESFQVPAAGLGKVIAGRLQDFPVGSVTHIQEGKFFIVRLADGILALNHTCTHMQCNLTYQPEHYRFYCACHYNKFTRKGEHIGHTPSVPPLAAYAVEIQGDQVIVNTDQNIFRSPQGAKQMVPVPAQT
jgi:Rieske Fe-S protein